LDAHPRHWSPDLDLIGTRVHQCQVGHGPCFVENDLDGHCVLPLLLVKRLFDPTPQARSSATPTSRRNHLRSHASGARINPPDGVYHAWVSKLPRLTITPPPIRQRKVNQGFTNTSASVSAKSTPQLPSFTSSAGRKVGALHDYLFGFVASSIPRKRSTASLGSKSSSSNNWRISISPSASSPKGEGKRLAHSSASSLDFT